MWDREKITDSILFGRSLFTITIMHTSLIESDIPLQHSTKGSQQPARSAVGSAADAITGAGVNNWALYACGLGCLCTLDRRLYSRTMALMIVLDGLIQRRPPRFPFLPHVVAPSTHPPRAGHGIDGAGNSSPILQGRYWHECFSVQKGWMNE
jgi:hypothetical protein